MPFRPFSPSERTACSTPNLSFPSVKDADTSTFSNTSSTQPVIKNLAFRGFCDGAVRTFRWVPAGVGVPEVGNFRVERPYHEETVEYPVTEKGLSVLNSGPPFPPLFGCAWKAACCDARLRVLGKIEILPWHKDQIHVFYKQAWTNRYKRELGCRVMGFWDKGGVDSAPTERGLKWIQHPNRDFLRRIPPSRLAILFQHLSFNARLFLFTS